MREIGFNGDPFAEETDAAESEGIEIRQMQAERRRCLHAIRQHAFAARFVDGRRKRVGERDAETLPARRDGSREPDGATADHEDVGH